jgi:23S rRNA-/tRNA-specific pseudouridylate synthase
VSTIVVPDGHDGSRLDALLHEVAGFSRKRARDLCAAGAVAIEHVRALSGDRVRAGQTVSFAAELAELTLHLRIAVVFADPSVVVLHKPPGLAVHGGPLVDHSVATALERVLPGAGLAQRLDRQASGLLLVGRDAQALKALGSAMERGAIDREYLAIASGVFERDARTIDLPLLVTDEPRGDRPKTIVDPRVAARTARSCACASKPAARTRSARISRRSATLCSATRATAMRPRTRQRTRPSA